MKNILLTTAILLGSEFAYAQFQYVSPKPGTVMVNAEHDIIIREGSVLDAASIQPGLFSIHDSKGKKYEFELKVSDDERSVVLNPLETFRYNDDITVSVRAGMKSKEGRKISDYSFSFKTHPQYTITQQQNFRKLKAASRLEDFGESEGDQEEAETRDLADLFTINININPTPGDIFFDALSGFFVPNEFTGYHVITPQGDSVYSKKPVSCSDFNLKQNGYPGLYNGDNLRFEVLDSNFNLVDKYFPANGYDADDHEFIILPDGHAFFICDEYQIIDMTIYNPNYSDSCTVNSSIIQEFDASHNLVFEWRSFDYITIPEATHVNLAAPYVDFVHTNSLCIDNDGNIIASHRRIDQVTKIDRNTGDFIWRLGGAMNEFTFINEPEPFTFQHDARRIANGNLTLHDNGNFHTIPHTAAKEYHLDEVNKTATLVWSYSHPNPNGGNPLFYNALGNVQRLSNGNTFICWGIRNPGSTNPAMSEVTPSGTIVWELTLTTANNMLSYRARKFDWSPCARPTLKKLKTESITSHSAKVKWADVANANQYTIQYKKHSDAVWGTKTVQATKHATNLSGLLTATKYDWRIQTKCNANGGTTSGYSESKKFTTLSVKDLTEYDSVVSVFIYPNPSSSYLTIDSRGEWNQIRIFNLLGQEVMSREFSNRNSDETINIELPLPSGNYIAELSNDSERAIEKFIVER